MRFSEHADSSLNLFIYGSHQLCSASTPSGSINPDKGLEGRLLSRSGVAWLLFPDGKPDVDDLDSVIGLDTRANSISVLSRCGTAAYVLVRLLCGRSGSAFSRADADSTVISCPRKAASMMAIKLDLFAAGAER